MTVSNPGAPALTPIRTGQNFVEVNNTVTLFSAATPNDGKQHMLILVGYVIVTVAQTGGTLVFTWNENGTLPNATVDPGGHAAAGTFPFTSVVTVADPFTNCALNQTTNLTAGAATVTYQLFMF